MTGGSSITEMTRIRPLHRAQARTSTLKTRRKRLAQSMREVPSLLVGRAGSVFDEAGWCPGADSPLLRGRT